MTEIEPKEVSFEEGFEGEGGDLAHRKRKLRTKHGFVIGTEEKRCDRRQSEPRCRWDRWFRIKR